MLNRITGILGGDPIGREIERYSSVVDEINNLEPSIQALSTPELKEKTAEFRQRLASGESEDDLLVETFAVVREAAIRTIGLRHFDVQLMGGAILHTGRIAEMKTGEGKTLVATMPIYLNALDGKGVHLITVNDYLARRDARWMGPIFHFLGMSVGVLQEASRTESGRKAFMYDPEVDSTQEDIHQLVLVDRKEAYSADITYGTNNEFGFDYLRDNMARSLEGRSQRGHHYAILDEVDNILIDEARTPLIISGPSHEDPELYEQMAKVVVKLRPEDYEINERDRTISLTEIGEDHTERILGEPLRDPDRPEDISAHQARLLGHLEQALRSEFIFKRNKDYVVQGGKVVIVDEFTGRLMAGRRWSDGLHQAVEAKEGVKIRRENVTYATITLQNYFRMYEKLAGMTGTALTEAEEFNKIYEVDVTPLPTNLEYVAMRPETDLVEVDYQDNGSTFAFYARSEDPDDQPVFWRRKDYPDVVYRTEEAKFRALAQEILTEHVRGRPLLVGTTSVELSEQISARLTAKSIRRQAMIMVIREAYLQANDLGEDGMRIEELEPLYVPLDQVGNSVMKPFARDLDVPLNPSRPENLDRLIGVLHLEPEDKEKLGQVLDAGIPHNVLNAKKHDEESRIIADAGAVGAVTIATNMAGRGVDIKLGGEIAEEVLAAVNRVLRRTGVQNPENLNMEEKLEVVQKANDEQIGIYGPEIDLFKTFMSDQNRVREVGGLHVVGSERHESRRIDNQLRGRAARQGDPGSSRFFLSLEDELMRLFGGNQVSGLMQRLNIDDAVPIAHGMVDRTIEQSQSRVEGAHFDSRKHLLEYDDVLNQQREIFYEQRNRVFSKDDLQDDVDQMIAFEVDRHITLSSSDEGDHWKLLAWLEETQPTLGMDTEHPYPSFMIKVILNEIEDVTEPDEVRTAMLDIARNSIDANLTYILVAIEEQVARTLERLDEQVEQRNEMAELAIEGVLLEAEETGREVQSSELIRAVEETAGMRIQLDNATSRQIAADPYQFRDNLPEMIEASLGMRVWQGLIKSVETRVGEELKVDEQMELPIDWDEAEERLLGALNDAWSTRTDRLMESIERELDAAVPNQKPVDEASKIRMLVDMSYGQKTFFDKKTHQRRTLMIARLSYAFWVADKLAEWEMEVLHESVLKHLQGAQDALQTSLGKAEMFRLGGSTLEDLDEKRQVRVRQVLGDEGFAEQAALGPIRNLQKDAKNQINRVLGQTTLTETYRGLILSVSDRSWVEYLTQMEALRTSIGLEAYGQRDPLVQYKSRAFDLFQQLLDDIRAEVVSRLYRAQPVMLAQTANAEASSSGSAVPDSQQAPAQQSSGKKKRRRRRRRR